MINLRGVVRKFDNLGRISIPIEMRRVFGIKKGAKMDIFLCKGKIILKMVKDENG